MSVACAIIGGPNLPTSRIKRVLASQWLPSPGSVSVCNVLGSCYDGEQSPSSEQYFIPRPNEELTTENDP